jgi:hypothetical protein
VTLPKKEKFTGNFYTVAEVNKLVEPLDGNVIQPEVALTLFYCAYNQSKIEIENCLDLKHTTESLLLAQGFQLKEIQEWLDTVISK